MPVTKLVNVIYGKELSLKHAEKEFPDACARPPIKVTGNKISSVPRPSLYRYLLIK